jgi:hypothetical protein
VALHVFWSGPTHEDFAACTTSYFDFFGHWAPCIMKSDAACHTAKSLLCLFTTTVVLAMFHLISRRIKKMLRQEYVTYTLNSIGYAILQHYFDIFIAWLRSLLHEVFCTGRHAVDNKAVWPSAMVVREQAHRFVPRNRRPSLSCEWQRRS